MASLTAAQAHKLKKFIKELELHRGSHTEFVTVYIPKGYDLNKIINHLSQEQGTASNIKSASTRKNVIDALEKMIQHLRLYKKTPEHGLAAFAGNIASRSGHQDFLVKSIEPPVPLKTRIYRCDKEFQLDLLRQMLETKEVYALLVMDRRDASLALLKGKTIIPILKTHSEVPGKFRAGGQSAPRFERLREGAVKNHYKKVADHMKNELLPNIKNLKGIIIGGPGPTKNDFVDGGFITGDLKKKIISVKDISYTGDFGLQELLDKAQDVLASEDIASEKEIMAKFFEMLSKHPNKVSYGEDEAKKSIGIGAVETLLLSENLGDERIEEFEQLAKAMSSEVKIISVETREGSQLKDIGGIAAILRYEVHT